MQQHLPRNFIDRNAFYVAMELDGRFIGMHFDTVPVQRGGGYSNFANAIINKVWLNG